MHEFSLDFLRCARCSSKLELDVFKKETEIEEGILECKKCFLTFPIINKIPILWDDFSKYLSERIMLGGKLFNSASHEKMKKFLKNSLSNCKRKTEDRTLLEERWSRIYQNSQKSKFYSNIKHELDALPKSKLVLEYGCSIGTMSNYLADTNHIVFGIDRSFSALSMAKKDYKHNLDYFVADFLSNIFGKTKFDLILALNVLELVEPIDYLKQVSQQIHAGTFVGVGDGIHDAQGMVRTIPLNDGSNVLRLENFKATNGPDLYVYLSTDNKASEFVSLGKLKANNGNQNYDLPENTDLEKYSKVLIWCKAFGVLFGNADLSLQ